MELESISNPAPDLVKLPETILSEITPAILSVSVEATTMPVPGELPNCMECSIEKLDLESSLPPSKIRLLEGLPKLASVANRTLPPLILMGPLNELPAWVISKTPVPLELAVKLIPLLPVLEIGPAKTIVPALPRVRVLLRVPK